MASLFSEAAVADGTLYPAFSVFDSFLPLAVAGAPLPCLEMRRSWGDTLTSRHTNSCRWPWQVRQTVALSGNALHLGGNPHIQAHQTLYVAGAPAAAQLSMRRVWGETPTSRHTNSPLLRGQAIPIAHLPRLEMLCMPSPPGTPIRPFGRHPYRTPAQRQRGARPLVQGHPQGERESESELEGEGKRGRERERGGEAREEGEEGKARMSK